MDKEKLEQVEAALRELANWSQHDSVEVGVTVTTDEYYFDLGQFGEHSTYVELSDDYYEMDVERVMGHAPSDPGVLADTVREIIDSTSELPSLDDVLAKLAANGTEEEQRLARVLTAVADAMRGFPTGVPGKMPGKPLPWPGALRDDIDYTADDFPLRYQPPPGYVWTVVGGNKPVPPESATKRPCDAMRNTSTGMMVLDKHGCVSWVVRGDDDLADDNGRWCVWFHERDGIPRGNSHHSGATRPLPISEEGLAMNGWCDSNGRGSAWNTDAEEADAVRRVAEIREQFEGAPPAKKEQFAPPEKVTI